MSDRNFSRRRRGGMRFRPSGGLGHIQQRPDRDAVQARAEAVGDQAVRERVYEHRHAHEIERAENIAAGLPPEGLPAETADATDAAKGNSRVLEAEPSAPLETEKSFEPVPVKEQPRGIVETIRAAATTLVKKVQRLIRPEKKLHKEVIINAETLETRVGGLEDGKLEEFNIERTTEERLVGSIFKGKIRNLAERRK